MEKRIFDRFANVGLIKSADLPRKSLPSDDRARLNRRGNELFNGGDTETARRIFQTTGYSDGLIRVGDRYLSASRPVDALKMYWLARDGAKSEALIEKAVAAIRKLLEEEVIND
ncbi:MAG TPA: hypothetical protein VMV44_15885 [Rectinemataceae bacterium]|nr:hypothetical protein [Rectinemataceae bacterium]